MSSPARTLTWSTCEDCDKRAYPNRKTARHAIRLIRPRDGRLHPYQCPAGPGWHVGHIPAAIKTGKTARKDYP